MTPVAEPRTTAELLVLTLVEHGVEVLFLNPGTDTAPVQEAFARLAADGVAVPRVVLCPHESLALAAAHAYFAVTGRPQVVMVHVDVGTQNLGAMVHNAFRADAGVVIIAGRTPRSSYGEEPGGRDTPVHWQQDVPDQAGIVRSYVRWTADLAGPETLAQQLSRAFQVAGAAPGGPVYLTAAREVLMQPVTEPVQRPVVARHRPPAPPAPHPDALERAAEVLARSARPLITTTRVGRQPEAVAELVGLAELLGAPVIDRRERVNFPSTHPLYVTDPRESQELLRQADAVLVVDSDVPWIPQRAQPAADASIVLIDHDPVRASVPGWSFPVDVPIVADPLIGLRQLTAKLRERGARQPDAAWWTRAAAAQSPGTDAGIAPADVARVLDGLLSEEDILIEEATTNMEALRSELRRTAPGTLYQAGGSGLGWALGASIGVRLASPERRVVTVVGDGSFMFSEPLAALWAARQQDTPFLTVVLRNGGYAASRRPVFALFPEGESSKNAEVVGTRLPDLPDFTAVAQSCEAHGEHVREKARLEPAIVEALKEVDGGRCALVAVDVTSPWL
ncbi:thiamine pyrophosphate-requiring protein [Saccharopolyspora sp. K220]|uniref:thiamine pyrophosphate-requiring protein n=1 Tax=Saccharopolyspora soli TaxID=2926618 RepID=UPI001F564C57|nr:thiamine pyrophosphate-requiring protein [Saccharopolyspora soli]MCI2423180.1 thiamine pyrophosphate-requiring protein [Saccharopolyspora soli]